MQKRYDRQIIIQRRSLTQSGSGASKDTWYDLAYKIFAGIADPAGDEIMAMPQKVAQQLITFTIRFHSIASPSRPLTPLDRIIYPVAGIYTNAQTPPIASIYDIVSAGDLGREVDVAIRARRRPEAS